MPRTDKAVDRASASQAGLERAIDEAIGGASGKLYALLARGSKLPGVRPNKDLADRFATACASRGAAADSLAETLATLDADRAPGATELEFLPMCGVAAAGARGASDPKSVPRMLALLEAASEDLRWRVREAVPPALARIGAVRGQALLEDVLPWMQGFFPATAVLIALARLEWLSELDEATLALARLEQAFELARDADRSAERYPGYKALLLALGTCPAVLAARFGPPAFDVLVRMGDIKEPMIREAIAKNLESTKLARRFAADLARVRRALEASAPLARDPRSYVGPTRRRGRRSR
jgi:hypothetical protein